jgi:hypothetical protein
MLPIKKLLDWKGLLLWSNQFYGICAASLCIASSMYIFHRPPTFCIIAFVYLSTLLYYTHAYLRETKEGLYNDRTEWYQRFKGYLLVRQVVLTVTILWLIIFKLHLFSWLFQVGIGVQAVLYFSAILSFSYYFPGKYFPRLVVIRAWGIFKSWTIAWVWAIACCFTPTILMLQTGAQLAISPFQWLAYFIKQLLYILLLAILFDIKDLIRDKEEMVNTIVLKYGVPYTLNKLAIPLLLFYYGLSVLLFFLHQESLYYLCGQTVLVLITFMVIRMIQHIKSIHYNMLLIDGLMLLKGLIGITMFYNSMI